MMGVSQIDILLANTTLNVLTANGEKKKNHLSEGCLLLSEPIICLPDTTELSINLVRLVWQVSENHALNIQGS